MSLPAPSLVGQRGPVPLPAEGHSVLIADDDAVLRDQLAEYLERRGFTCFTAGDGAEAIDVMERFHPEVALLDVRMPDISGLDVAAITADLEPRPKIIFMSGYAEAVTAANAAELEAFTVIEKPVPLRDVARQLELAFDD